MNPGNVRTSDGWVTVSAAAEMSRISAQTVYNYMKRGDLKSKNRSGRTYVDPEEVRVLAAQRWSRSPVTATTVPVSEANQREHEIARERAMEEPTMTATDAIPATSSKLDQARAWVEQERESIRTARAALDERAAAIAAERELLDVRELEIIDAENAFALLDRISTEGLGR